MRDDGEHKAPLGSSAATTIYTFGAISGDAGPPFFALVEGRDGNFYGTAATGGSPSTACPQSCGVVFKVTPEGQETVLHSFGASDSDGRSPSGALILASDGNFYGVTRAGGVGSSNCTVADGCGTVYRVTASGVESVLYSFGTQTSEGVGPGGTLLQASDGNLYGTTSAGGLSGSGTVFRVEMGLSR